MRVLGLRDWGLVTPLMIFDTIEASCCSFLCSNEVYDAVRFSRSRPTPFRPSPLACCALLFSSSCRVSQS